MTDWTEEDDKAWAEAPERVGGLRVLAVIQRDHYSGEPDGDAYEPTLVGYGWGRQHYAASGTAFRDVDVLDAFLTACDRWDVQPASAGWERGGIVARYMRIFHETTFGAASSCVEGYANVIVFNTPNYREHVGQDAMPDTVEAGDWEHYINGDVFGIGWALVPDGHDLDGDGLSGLDVEIECWGLYGEDYAKDAALRFDHGGPDEHAAAVVIEATTDHYGWEDFELDDSTDLIPDKYILTITEDGEEFAVIIHRATAEHPIDGPLAERKRANARLIVSALNDL